MKTLLKQTKIMVEKCIKEKKCAKSVLRDDDPSSTFDAEDKAIEDDGVIYYIPLSNPSVTLQVK